MFGDVSQKFEDMQSFAEFEDMQSFAEFCVYLLIEANSCWQKGILKASMGESQ